MIMEDTKLRCTPCTNDMDNIPLDDPVQQAPLPENANPVVLLTRETRILDAQAQAKIDASVKNTIRSK